MPSLQTKALVVTPISGGISDRRNVQFGKRLKEHQKAVFLCKKENSALSEETYRTNHTIGWGNS